MKTKLFAAAISLFIYVLFVVGFTLSDGAVAHVSKDFNITSNQTQFYDNSGNLIDPTPRPPKYGFDGGNLIDPTPRPPKRN